MYTQCPECRIAFRVTAKVLQQAAGNVRCGSCEHVFNAIQYLSEEMPDVMAPSGREEPGEARGDPLAETSRRLLETLDELAGPEDVRIEDTGVEWRVLDDTLDELDAPRAGERRYDDNSPLPDDDDLDEPWFPPPRRRAEDRETPSPEFEDRQGDLALSEPGEWTDILEEVRDSEAALYGIEEELVAIHQEMSARDDATAVDRVDDLDPADPGNGPFETRVEAPELDTPAGDEALTDEVPQLDDTAADPGAGDAEPAESSIDLLLADDAGSWRAPRADGDAATEAFFSDVFDADEAADTAVDDDGDTDLFVLDDREPAGGAPFEIDGDSEAEAFSSEVFDAEGETAAMPVSGGEDIDMLTFSEEMFDEDVAAAALRTSGDDEFEDDVAPEAGEDVAEPAGVDALIDDVHDLPRVGEDDQAAPRDFAATMVGMENPEDLFDASSGEVETIIMEGDMIRTEIERERQAAESAARNELDDPARLMDTYALSRKKLRGGRRSYDPPATGMIAAIAVLSLLLVGQFVHQSRQALATYGFFDHTIGPVYRMFGSPVTPEWDIRGWQFEATTGSMDDEDTTLTIVSRIVNRSEQALPYPLIHVSLTNRFEDIMGSRILEPGEYLAGNPDPSIELSPGDRFDAVIAIENPSAEATGFKLNVCYRVEAGSVRCAIEDFK